MTARFHIGDLARITATKVVTIRYYEQAGLLPEPPRSDGNYRLYSQAHLDRLRFIRRARDLGFSLGEIRSLLLLAGNRSRSCADVDRLTRLHLEEVECKIADLCLLRDELRQTIGNCTDGTIAECRILAAFTAGKQATTSPDTRTGRAL